MTVGLLSFASVSQTVDVVIFAGQSNAQSNGTTTLAPPTHITVDSGVQLWDYDTSQFLTYHAGVNSLQPTTNNNGASDCWGAEAEFAYQYRQANPTKTLYLVKYAIGSTQLAQSGSVTDWSPASTNEFFGHVETATAAAKAALVALGKAPVVRMVLWMQGEQDASDSTLAAAYQTNLGALITAARSRWGDANSQFTIGRINYTWEVGATQESSSTPVRIAEAAVSAGTVNAPLIDTDFYHLTGSNHFDDIGCPQFGRDIWRAYIGQAQRQFVTNGTFSVDFSGWQGFSFSPEVSNNAALSVSSGTLLITNAPSATIALAVTPLTGLIVGELYVVKFDITRNDNANAHVRVTTDSTGIGNDLGGSGAMLSDVSVSGTVTGGASGFIATAATHYLSFTNYSGATSGSLGIDNVTVTGA